MVDHKDIITKLTIEKLVMFDVYFYYLPTANFKRKLAVLVATKYASYTEVPSE